MKLGENIYRLRTEKNMSQGDLADALDVSRQSVSKWENGSAVPELEKLMKMRQLFGVSLDELAGMEQQEKEAAQPQIIYIEKPVMPKISNHILIGVFLLVGSLFYGMLLNSSVLGSAEALILAIPVAICGAICLRVTYPQLWCGWVCAAAYWLYLLILFHNSWEQQHILLLFGIVFVIVMIAWSVKVHKKGIVHIPAWLWVLGSVVLLAAFVLLWLNTVPPFEIALPEYATSSVKE